MKCVICNSDKIPQAAEFCPNCGTQLKIESTRDKGTERLKILGGESRFVTLFFVDFIIMNPAEDKITKQNIIYLSDLMEKVAAIVKKYDGTVNRIMPDYRLLIIFGAPKVHTDDPNRAVRCVLEIKKYLYERRRLEAPITRFNIKIGINSGWIFFGYVLENPPFLTVIGDTVNIAARLAQMSMPDQILMSENTYNLLPDLIVAEHIGMTYVRGRSGSLDVYNLIDIRFETLQMPKCPFWGRKEEMARLIALTQKIKENRISIGIITGQMGIGKTRLKEEFENFLRADGSFRFIESHCTVEMQTPYYPFKLLFREYFNLKESDSRANIAEKIDRFVSENNLDPQEIKGIKHLFLTDLQRLWGENLISINEEIFIAVGNLLRFECKKNPLVIIFEEFNRADSMTKNLVAYLAAELVNNSIMFLLINYTGDLFKKDNNNNFEEINLGPLSKETIANLVNYYLTDADPNLIEFLYKTTGGNPLFTIETIKNVKRRNIIKKEASGRWLLDREKHFTFLDDLYSVVMSGLDALAPEYRLIIDYASVIGYSFNYHILKEILEDEENLLERLNYLKNEDYIIQFKDDTDPIYIFRHNLLKDAAYTTLPLKKRKELHRRVAVLLEKSYSEQLSEYYETIGYHYHEAENYKKAAEYFKMAGDKAKNLYAIEQAINFYNNVLKIGREYKEQISPNLLRQTELNLTDIYEILGDTQRMKEIAESGLSAAEIEKNQKEILLFSERKAISLLMSGDYKSAESLLLESVENCPAEYADVLTQLYSDLGLLYAEKYEYEKSILNYNLTWNTARTYGIKEGEIRCLLNLSQLHTKLGNYELAYEYLNYGLDELITEENLRPKAQYKYNLGILDYQVWNLNKAIEQLTEAFNIAERSSHEIQIKSALELALIHSLMQNYDEAARLVEYVDKKITPTIREILLSEINLKKAIFYENKKERERVVPFLTNALKLAQKYNQQET
ncbi:MAG: AAA family ATPase, partial [candidate division WOR-3 bacterium]